MKFATGIASHGLFARPQSTKGYVVRALRAHGVWARMMIYAVAGGLFVADLPCAK